VRNFINFDLELLFINLNCYNIRIFENSSPVSSTRRRCSKTAPKKQSRNDCKSRQIGSVFGIIELMKNKKHHVNYDMEKRNVQLKIDEIIAEKIIPADDSVRLSDEIMEEMDYTPLLRAYKRTGRRPATNPVTMLKILVYAIMEGVF